MNKADKNNKNASKLVFDEMKRQGQSKDKLDGFHKRFQTLYESVQEQSQRTLPYLPFA